MLLKRKSLHWFVQVEHCLLDIYPARDRYFNALEHVHYRQRCESYFFSFLFNNCLFTTKRVYYFKLLLITFCVSFTQYFVVYKLGEEYTGQKELPYAADFMPYLAFASQIPNVIFNWFNIFIQIGYGVTNQFNFFVSLGFC